MLSQIDKLFMFFTRPVFIVADRFDINQKELERFLKFMVVGTVGFVVDFGTLNLLVLLAGLPVLVANTISSRRAKSRNALAR